VAQAVTAALLARTGTGQGQAIEICMLDVAIAAMWPDGMMNDTISAPDETLTPISRSFRVTPTNDGFISFVALTPRQQEQFLKAVGLGATRTTGELLRQAAAIIAKISTQDAVDRLSSHDVPVAPILQLNSVYEHPQVQANGSIDEFVHPHLGTVRQPNPAVRFDGRRAGELRPAGRLGEHNEEIMIELDFDEAAIQKLIASGALVVETEVEESPP
jgi:crotonobetainyl-CoA:carnitine CoA-transferase CaiB-like acyl-CoA transferase